MTYRVEVTEEAEGLIIECAQYIAADNPAAAGRWLSKLFEKIERLSTMHRRYPLADENAFRPYEVRKLNFGDYLALYTVDDSREMVWVIGFRRGQRLPRLDELPPDIPT